MTRKYNKQNVKGRYSISEKKGKHKGTTPRSISQKARYEHSGATFHCDNCNITFKTPSYQYYEVIEDGKKNYYAITSCMFCLKEVMAKITKRQI